MLRKTIIDIFYEAWPMILICTVILTATRLFYLILNKKQFVLYKELLSLGFIIYIMALFYVVTFQDVSWSTSNFIPFKEMFRYELGTRLFYKNVLGNTLMFIPFGFFISYFLKNIKIRYTIIITLIASLTIEFTQLAIGRVFDIDDIVLNIIGGTLGALLYILLYKIKDKLPDFLKKEIFYNIAVILAIVLIILYLFNVFGVM